MRRFVLVSGAVTAAERELEVKMQLSYFVRLQGNQNCKMFVKNLKLDTWAITAGSPGDPGTHQPRYPRACCAGPQPILMSASSREQAARLLFRLPPACTRRRPPSRPEPASRTAGAPLGLPRSLQWLPALPWDPQFEGRVVGGWPGRPLGTPHLALDTCVPAGARPSLRVAPGRHE